MTAAVRIDIAEVLDTAVRHSLRDCGPIVDWISATAALEALAAEATAPPAPSSSLGSALRDVLGVRREERVMLVLLDTPEYAYAFLGTIKIGAVPIPTNTLLKPPDYEYLLNDSRARILVVSQALLPQLQAIPREA